MRVQQQMIGKQWEIQIRTSKNKCNVMYAQ